jgi:hypothetical protein
MNAIIMTKMGIVGNSMKTKGIIPVDVIVINVTTAAIIIMMIAIGTIAMKMITAVLYRLFITKSAINSFKPWVRLARQRLPDISKRQAALVGRNLTFDL